MRPLTRNTQSGFDTNTGLNLDWQERKLTEIDTCLLDIREPAIAILFDLQSTRHTLCGWIRNGSSTSFGLLSVQVFAMVLQTCVCVNH